MRWTDLFSHLEHDFAQDARTPRESSFPDDVSDVHFMEVCLRAKAAGGQITVGVTSGDVFHVWPRAVSSAWFSGLIGGSRGSGVVVPLTAVVWVEGSSFPYGNTKPAFVSATVRDVLTDMARRRATVSIRTLHSDYVGVFVRVGNDFCDVAGQSTSSPGGVRRFSFAAIVAVFQGSTAWG